MSNYNKSLPVPTECSRPFWEGTKCHELLVQECGDCHELIMYPKKYCPKCLSANLSWIKASGKGKIYSFTVVYNNPPSLFVDGLPFVVAIIRLEEGVQMMSNIVDYEVEDLRCDMDVEVCFDDVTREITLPKFKPVVKISDK